MKNLTVNMISETEYFPKAHGVHSAYWNMVEMLRQKGIKVLINSRQKADITHVQTIGPFSLYKLLSSKPTVASAHIIPASFPGSLVGTKYWLPISQEYLKFFYNRANLVLAVSPQVKIDLKDMGVKSPIEVMPNVVNTNLFRPDGSLREVARKRLGFKKGDFVALGVGQIQPRKGIATFLQAARELPEVQFLWVGSRPFKKLTAGEDEIQKLLKDPPSNFTLFGAGGLPYGEMPQFYNTADIFFFPSYQENFGMVVVEAAATRLPLLLRDLPVYKIFQGHYICGNDENFADNIKKLTKEQNFYSEWSKRSEALSKKFNFDSLGDKLIGYYESLLS